MLDASATVELVLGELLHAAVAARIVGAREVLQAPAVIDLEVLQAFRRYEWRGLAGPDRMQQFVRDFSALPIRRHPHQPYAQRIWELRHNITAYDASYVALAEALDAPLVTCDARLAAAPGHRATIELISA